MVNVTQGPGGHSGSELRRRLAEKGLKLPILGDDDETADFNYIKHIMLDLDSETLRLTPSDREVGKPFGLEWASGITTEARFHPSSTTTSRSLQCGSENFNGIRWAADC